MTGQHGMLHQAYLRSTDATHEQCGGRVAGGGSWSTAHSSEPSPNHSSPRKSFCLKG